MMEFIQSVAAFILALGILITFHEFGHYWVARRCGVRVLRFSVGFGKPVWRFDFTTPFWYLGFTHNPWHPGNWGRLLRQRAFEPGETEFVLAALPLGGYVKMLDEREGEVRPEERGDAFNNKSLSQRLAIVLAGPVFNLVFAVIAYWLVYMIGVNGLKPVIGEVEPDSIAMQAGFEPGQQILSIDGARTPTWMAVLDSTVPGIVDGDEMVFEVSDASGTVSTIRIDMARISIDEMASGRLLTRMGLTPRMPVYPAKLGDLTPDGAAAAAGLQAGDLIIAADGVPMNGWSDWVAYVRERPGTPIRVRFSRADGLQELEVTPAAHTLDSGEVIGRIGAALDTTYEPDDSYYTLENYAVVPALVRAMDRTMEMSLMTLRILGKMLIGEASVKNLSGPITIAKYAGDTVDLGMVAFLSFLAIVSVSLGVLNLLPVPMLDGGHVLYYLIEAAKGSPLSEHAQIIGQQLGLVLLLGLMGLALYNDILRVIG